MTLWIYGAGQDRERKKITSTRTTRYVTLLSVVLALALTVALAACGSDEPAGVTGPDRTASTPTETSGLPRTDAYHDRVRGRAHCHRYACTCGYHSAARGLRLRRKRTGRRWLPSTTQRHGFQWLGISNYTEDEVKWLSDAPLGEWEGVYH